LMQKFIGNQSGSCKTNYEDDNQYEIKFEPQTHCFPFFSSGLYWNLFINDCNRCNYRRKYPSKHKLWHLPVCLISSLKRPVACKAVT
jgi:hypothetical protein